MFTKLAFSRFPSLCVAGFRMCCQRCVCASCFDAVQVLEQFVVLPKRPRKPTSFIAFKENTQREKRPKLTEFRDFYKTLQKFILIYPIILFYRSLHFPAKLQI